MRAAMTSLRVVACLAVVAGIGALPAPAHATARLEVDAVSSVLRAGEPARMRVRLSFTGERSCRLAYVRRGVSQVTPDTLTERQFVTWHWRVPRNAASGRWRLEVSCGAEAELTARVARHVRLVGVAGGRRVAARRVTVFTSGLPLVAAFINSP